MLPDPNAENMTLWDHYHLPNSVEEALAALATYEGGARVVAGGTDLLLEMQQGRKPPVAALVDVTRIPEMTTITEGDGYIFVGASVTHAEIVQSELLAQHATCLVESCGVIGGPQVRNVATLGGNVAHALPAADGTISLVALEAEAEIVGCRLATADRRPPAVRPAQGTAVRGPPSAVSRLPSSVMREWRPVLSLFQGPGKSAVDQTREMIVGFRFRPTRPGEASAFERIMRPQGVALPILAIAARLERSGGLVQQVTIAIGPAGPTPMRATDAEASLAGRPLNENTIEVATALVLAQARLRTSKHRASEVYRRELIEPLVRRCLCVAYERCEQEVVVPEGIGSR